jgi:hypothetical protein
VNLSSARQGLAAALSTVTGVTVRARPSKAAPKAGDGWVAVQRLAPADFSSCMVTLAAVVVLASDQVKAEETLDTIGVALIDAVTESSIYPADVFLEPETLAVGQTAAPLYAAVVTASMLVDNSDES